MLVEVQRMSIEMPDGPLANDGHRRLPEIPSRAPWLVKGTLWASRLRHLSADMALEAFRERLYGRHERRYLDQVRAGHDVCWAEDFDPEPLVTIRVATYSVGALLVERALRSALAQTYRNVEVLVIGDNCDVATAAAAAGAAAEDARVRFINLPRRGLYPEQPSHRWMVAGAHPMNVGLALARGAWIAPLDDDDEFTPDHVESLLAAAVTQRVELIYSRAAMQRPDGGWWITQGPPLRHGHISHGSVLYSTRLGFFQHSNTSWMLREPGDWNLWKRMQRAGVKIGFLDDVTYAHYEHATADPASSARTS